MKQSPRERKANAAGPRGALGRDDRRQAERVHDAHRERTAAQALLWAIETAIEAEGEWFEGHWPSEYGGDWLQAAMEKRLKFERLAIVLRERAWPDWRRAESLAVDAGKLAATILRKCATDLERTHPAGEEVANGAA